MLTTGMGWWNPEAVAPDFGGYDVNVNAALSYTERMDPMIGSVDTRGVACRAVKVSSPATLG